jgi:SAM-dependent methyltransferase
VTFARTGPTALQRPTASSADDCFVYEDPEVVAFYADVTGLQAPERAILSVLAPELSRARMLDIGVGGGRTAAAIAPLVGEYVGVDFSPAMIETCRTTFAGKFQNSRFEVADARCLDTYADTSFDIVLFSHNGLDSIDYGDRMQALGEMRRVLRPGGYLWFSTHNKFLLGELFSFIWPSSPRYFPGQVRRLVRIHAKNFPASHHTRPDYSFTYDGLFNFRARILYMDPRRQLRDLRDLGFNGVRAFGLREPVEIPATAEDLAMRRDAWIYFLCQRGPE